MIIVNAAENGYVVENRENNNESYFFVAIDVDDACSIIKMLLEEEAYVNSNLSDLAFEQVPRDK